MNPEQKHSNEALPEEVIENTDETQRPGLLDVVKIDGRWAQVRYGGNVVQYLDDNAQHQINWNDYSLIRKWESGVSVGLYREFKPGDINDAQLQNTYWGDNETKNPEYLKKQVHVFGEYKKKENSV